MTTNVSSVSDWPFDITLTLDDEDYTISGIADLWRAPDGAGEMRWGCEFTVQWALSSRLWQTFESFETGTWAQQIREAIYDKWRA